MLPRLENTIAASHAVCKETVLVNLHPTALQFIIVVNSHYITKYSSSPYVRSRTMPYFGSDFVVLEPWYHRPPSGNRTSTRYRYPTMPGFESRVTPQMGVVAC